MRVLHYLDLHVQEISHHFVLPKATPDCQNADMSPLHTIDLCRYAPINVKPQDRGVGHPQGI